MHRVLSSGKLCKGSALREEKKTPATRTHGYRRAPTLQSMRLSHLMETAREEVNQRGVNVAIVHK